MSFIEHDQIPIYVGDLIPLCCRKLVGRDYNLIGNIEGDVLKPVENWSGGIPRPIR
jgi:hypothetical protein